MTARKFYWRTELNGIEIKKTLTMLPVQIVFGSTKSALRMGERKKNYCKEVSKTWQIEI